MSFFSEKTPSFIGIKVHIQGTDLTGQVFFQIDPGSPVPVQVLI